jgi:hypothetical protein
VPVSSTLGAKPAAPFGQKPSVSGIGRKPCFCVTAHVREASRIIYPSLLSGKPLGIKQVVDALSR